MNIQLTANYLELAITVQYAALVFFMYFGGSPLKALYYAGVVILMIALVLMQ